MAQLHINQENLFQGPSVSVSGNVTSWEGTGEHLNSEELIYRDCAGRSFLSCDKRLLMGLLLCYMPGCSCCVTCGPKGLMMLEGKY